MSDAVIEIENVTKRFDDLVAVDQVTLRLERGKTLGLIGPNGAGKTTLLRLISTLARPDSGDIRVEGESAIEAPRAVRLKLGFMPAEFGSPRNLTILEYLEYFGCMYGIPKGDRQQRIKDVCELTDLSGREGVMVKGLSTGNKQRLLLAKTLLHDPEVLVLDEPASGLDPRARTALRAIIRALAGMGKTIIISSHILPDIEQISDQIGILEAGRLVLDGQPAARDKCTHRLAGLRNPLIEALLVLDVVAIVILGEDLVGMLEVEHEVQSDLGVGLVEVVEHCQGRAEGGAYVFREAPVTREITRGTCRKRRKG